jgi:inner membrane transporter RhtA
MTVLLQMALNSAGPPEPNRVISPIQLGLGAALGRLPPSALLLLAVLSIQLSSAIATFLFSSLGPAGTALLATVFSAAALTLASPPRIDSRFPPML